MAKKKRVIIVKKKKSSQKGNFSVASDPQSGQGGMRIIALKTLREFWEGHEDAEESLKAWYQEALRSKWSEPNDIKKRYPSADIIPGNRIVFNIKGNTYRLIVKIHYNTGIVYIRFVGTHAEYDKVDAETI
jgi:mRNA interferase HigB